MRAGLRTSSNNIIMILFLSILSFQTLITSKYIISDQDDAVMRGKVDVVIVCVPFPVVLVVR